MIKPEMSIGLMCATMLWVLSVAPEAAAQRVTDVVDGTLTVTVPFGNMTPGTSPTPSSQTVQFRLRHTAAYRVTASAVFSVTPAGPVAGGTTITAGDIGVGITSITTRPQVELPRTDVIAAGFSYDPSAVVAVNGLSPYLGQSSGQATLQNIINSPGMTLLTGPRIAANDNLVGNNYLTVTLTFGLVRQYFTPASASAVITLVITNQ